MNSYTSIYGTPPLPNRKSLRINQRQAAYLCRMVIAKGWTEKAFVRYLRFISGCYKTEDLYSWDYARAIIDLDNPVMKEAFHGETDISDGHKVERRWHYELDRDEFYAAFSLSEMSDEEVFDTISLTWSDAGRASLAFKELKHRLDSYRHIAMILELQQGG